MIGPCAFSQLPEHYQQLFESGQVHKRAHLFLPYKSDGCAPWVALLLGIPFLVIAISVVALSIRSLVQNPDVVEQMRSDLTSSWRSFILLFVIFVLLLGGTFAMVRLGVGSVADAWVRIRTQRARASGAQYYGLLLDRENLVIRHGSHLEEYTCAFLPRSAITECFVDKLRVEGAKFARYIDVVKLWYKDNELAVREIVLREHFDLSAAEMQAQIQRWRTNRST